ncbi:MAG: 5'-methylthioadenosine/adenosylhomocysteine nucleosidase [Erysipelotrichaceae bacterium]|nr:5'-methylthioadenosine/adenosylhomocysteine nucleosidase [Erysipelotrichaceae bacterium]
MIAVICAMKQERDALLKMMKDVKVVKGKRLLYLGKELDNEYYIGTLEDKEVVLSRCGIGEIYAVMSTMLMIEKFKPELLINLGCAGSLNENVHVNDIVVADRIANWRVDVPGWKRNIDDPTCSFPCDLSVTAIAKKIRGKQKIHIGNIVSADEFIYKKSQVKEIKKHFPDALCGEMEGCAVAGTAYAFETPVAVIRSISDETLIQGDFKQFDFNLEKVCASAARVCKQIIKRFGDEKVV